MPQDRPYVVRFPDGSTKTYPPGMDQVAIAQDAANEMPKRGGDPQLLSQITARPGSQPPAPIQQGPGNFETPHFRETAGDMLALGAGLIPGAGLPAIGARMGGAMLGGAIGSGMEGIKKQGLMQGVGEAVAAAAPPLGLLLGSITGGTGVGKQARDAIGAFMRERNRAAGPLRGLHNTPTAVPVVGSRIPSRKLAAGKAIEKFEEGRPEQVPVETFKGKAGVEASKVRHKTEDPEDFVRGFNQRGSNIVFKHVADVHGISQATLNALINGPSATTTSRSLAQMLFRTANRSVRETGELHRDMASKAREILNEFRKAPGERVGFSPEVKDKAMQSLKVSQDIKDAKEAVLPAGVLKELQELEARFSDLAKMQAHSSRLWGGGGLLSPGGVGAAGVKGGVASGLARAAIGGTTGFGLGMDPATAALLFAGATPANLARAGNLLGDVGELGPTIMRGTELVKGKKTERKRPGG